MTLGERIKARREEIGLSLRGLATKAVLSHVFLWELEQDRKSISANNLFRLAEVLGVFSSFLMGEITEGEMASIMRKRNRR